MLFAHHHRRASEILGDTGRAETHEVARLLLPNLPPALADRVTDVLLAEMESLGEVASHGGGPWRGWSKTSVATVRDLAVDGSDDDRDQALLGRLLAALDAPGARKVDDLVEGMSFDGSDLVRRYWTLEAVSHLVRRGLAALAGPEVAGGWTITDDGREELSRLRVIGHADPAGDADLALVASLARLIDPVEMGGYDASPRGERDREAVKPSYERAERVLRVLLRLSADPAAVLRAVDAERDDHVDVEDVVARP